jgi:endonuclease/exonuclease/phosphatase family metal-dependent hydrolase
MTETDTTQGLEPQIEHYSKRKLKWVMGIAGGVAITLALGGVKPPPSCASLEVKVKRGQAKSGLRVSTYNIAGGIRGINNVAAAITREQSDVTCLQEVHASQLGTLATLTGLPHAVPGWSHEQEGEPFGNAVLTRLPVVNSKTYQLPSSRDNIPRSVLMTTLKQGDSEIIVAATHLATKTRRLFGKNSGDERQLQAKEVLEILGKDPAYEGKDHVICADLNIGDKSQVYKSIDKAYDDAVAALGQEDEAVTFPPLDARIDFIWFNTGEWKPVSFQTYGRDASDHCGVTAVLAQQ